MNTAENNARQSSAFVESALSRIRARIAVARDLVDALELPQEACSAVLSGMVPTLLEEFSRNEQRKGAHSSSQNSLVEEAEGSEQEDHS
jgi:hypothetical protein